MNAIVDFPSLGKVNAYTQLELDFDRELRTLFSWMNPSPRPCFNPVLVDEIGRSEKLCRNSTVVEMEEIQLLIVFTNV